MNHEHYYVYTFGSLRMKDVTLDEVAKRAAHQPDHIILLKHADQLDEVRGLSLMYGVELKVDTLTNWKECNRYRDVTGGKRKRLPNLVFSNYMLPNIMGI